MTSNPGIFLVNSKIYLYDKCMPQRKIIISTGEIYHVFNRGVARMPIFSANNDFLRFLDVVDYCRFTNTPFSFSHFKKLPAEQKAEIMLGLQKEKNLHVEILAFCLMDNHYHFLVKQMAEKGITTWMSNVQNGYAKYYNSKNQRTGPLFQPRFQAVRIETDEQLLHVSRYIHLNPSTGYLTTIEALGQYPWSSLPYYLGLPYKYIFISSEEILKLSNGKKNYREFVFNQAEYQRELAKIKHLTFE